MRIGISITLPESCVIFHIINTAFLKINSGQYWVESLKNMILSSFNLLSGGNGGQRILGIQLDSTRTTDLDSRWWITYSFWQRSALPEKDA